jgi:coenzyme F420-0:L-glutamate ligase/coenzyme F420-1:gamma-L-glutamate ligase
LCWRPVLASSVTITGIEGIPEVKAGDNLAEMIVGSARDQGYPIQAGDVLVVTQKIVSKAEGRFVDLNEITPSPLAVELATNWEKDARHVEVVLRESRRVVRMDHGVIICETRHGFVCANAGVDASNVPGNDRVLLLPVDPDESAAGIRKGIMAATGADVAVIISDTFGRPWRTGYTEVAIGVAGMLPIIDYVGLQDAQGRELKATWICVADELASCAELVTGKINQVPASLIRGYDYPRGEGNAREMVRQAEKDMFR